MADLLDNKEVSDSNLTPLTQNQDSNIQNGDDLRVNSTIQAEGKDGNQEIPNQKIILSRNESLEMDSSSSIDLAERYLSATYDFRINKILGRLEFRGKTDQSYVLLDDYKFNSIIREMLKRKIKISKDTLKSLVYSDYAEIYDPFEEYFNSLPQWDGVTDHIGQLAETVKTDDGERWRMWFKKWIVAAVACAIHESKINHTAIIFAGKQGIGKTTWMQRLVPFSLKNYFYSGIPNLRNKDTKIRMAECFLINLDEMDSLTVSNTERLKEIITTVEIKERRPYGYFDQTMPRRASFMGSVNNKQFLNDTTGNRRFLCFEVNDIDFKHSVDMDLVYAQAKHLLENDFPYYFSQGEIDEVAEHNERFQAVSAVEEMILKCFEPIDTEKENPALKLTATEIGEYLSKKGSFIINDANIQKIGRIMKKHNFVRLKFQGNYVYALGEKG